jgi:hypothetical protein
MSPKFSNVSLLSSRAFKMAFAPVTPIGLYEISTFHKISFFAIVSAKASAKSSPRLFFDKSKIDKLMFSLRLFTTYIPQIEARPLLLKFSCTRDRLTFSPRLRIKIGFGSRKQYLKLSDRSEASGFKRTVSTFLIALSLIRESIRFMLSILGLVFY